MERHSSNHAAIRSRVATALDGVLRHNIRIAEGYVYFTERDDSSKTIPVSALVQIKEDDGKGNLSITNCKLEYTLVGKHLMTWSFVGDPGPAFAIDIVKLGGQGGIEREVMATLWMAEMPKGLRIDELRSTHTELSQEAVDMLLKICRGDRN